MFIHDAKRCPRAPAAGLHTHVWPLPLSQQGVQQAVKHHIHSSLAPGLQAAPARQVCDGVQNEFADEADAAAVLGSLSAARLSKRSREAGEGPVSSQQHARVHVSLR